MSTNHYNRPEIVQFLTYIAAGIRSPRELRTLMPHGKIWSGIFDDVERMASAACGISLDHHPLGVYFGLHHPHHALITSTLNTVRRNARETVRTSQIMNLGVLLIDVDPVRPSGVCATDEEKAEAWSVATRVRDYLSSKGWPDPVAVDSGNGYHLYYRAYGCAGGSLSHQWRYILGWLSRTFGSDEANVDTSVWDAARISRLPGTMNRKGPNTIDRPHRMARVLSYPAAWVQVPNLYNFAVSQGYVPPPSPEERDRKREQGDVPELLIDEDGVGELISEFPDQLDLSGSVEKDGCTYFYLRSCPFNGGPHRDQGGKTAIILSQETIGFKCFSSDCEHYGFRDLLNLLKDETGRKPSMPIYSEVQHAIVMGRYLPKWGCQIVDVQREEERARRKAARRAERKAARRAARLAERKAARRAERKAAREQVKATLERMALVPRTPRPRPGSSPARRAAAILKIMEAMVTPEPPSIEEMREWDEFRWADDTWAMIQSGELDKQDLSTDPEDWGLTVADLTAEYTRVATEQGIDPEPAIKAGDLQAMGTVLGVTRLFAESRWKTRPMST